MASRQMKNDEQLQEGTSATLNNQTANAMQFMKSFTWSGTFDAEPKPIPSKSVVTFQHLNPKEEEPDVPEEPEKPKEKRSKAKAEGQGSSGAVCYTITNNSNAALAIVLAWNAPADSTDSNQVFGGIADKGVIDGMSESQIQSMLANAGPYSQTTVEGVTLQASLTNNPNTKKADLSAYFQ